MAENAYLEKDHSISGAGPITHHDSQSSHYQHNNFHPEHSHPNHHHQNHYYPNRYEAYPHTNSNGFAQADGGSLHPGLWKPYEHRKFANPAPMGLCAFACTTFVASCVSMEIRGVKEAAVVIPLAFIYGGFVQILTGMWEMAVGNTFGATTFAAYGAYWIAYGILYTPFPWAITQQNGPYDGNASAAIGFFMTAWFIFTTLMLLCTLRSTWALFLLFFFLDLVYLFSSVQNYAIDMGKHDTATALKKTAGFFGFCAAFFAWYNALAGILDSSNSFFTVPVFHFPWSDKGLEDRGKKPESATV